MKKELQQKKELARMYFMQGTPQNEIAERIGISKQTVNRWVADGKWTEERAARSITRTEIVNKLLLSIDSLINEVNQSNDPKLLASLGDKLSKLSSVIERLDKKASVATFIETFMAFGKWLQYRSTWDTEITPELLKSINHYQDLFIAEQISKH
ncbi:MAG: DUF1804 family protein [Bacteroidales bacterium]|nr:DUF1804 family protein [Bacteroidales bacterium]MBR5028593.1 DUF1804 family protein [Bacteroidales bacterium]